MLLVLFVNGGLPREPVIVTGPTPHSAPQSENVALPVRKPAVSPPHSLEADVEAAAGIGARAENGTAADYNELRRKLLSAD